jgi:hypothetical protein
VTLVTIPLTRARPLSRGMRVLELLLAAVFVGSGAAKLLAVPSMVSLFAEIGVGQWFRLVIGVTELAGGVLLLSRVLAGVGAVMLTGVMAGAIMTNVLVLRTSPLVPTMTLLALVTVSWHRRTELAALARRLPGIRAIIL